MDGSRFSELFWKEKILSYNQRNTVTSSGLSCHGSAQVKIISFNPIALSIKFWPF